jgi:hypothetical protein
MNYIKSHYSRPALLISIFIAAVCAQLLLPMLVGRSSAASLSNSYIRLTRMKTATGGSSAVDLRIVFKTTSTAGATGFTVDMNGTDTGTARWTDAANSGAVATSGMTVTNVSGGCDVGATQPAGSASVSGATSILTVTGVTALSANTIYCWDITKAATGVVTTPTVAGEYHPTITETGGATDSVTDAIRIVSNDQITVNATVPPTFNLAISGCASNTDAFTTNLTATTHTSTSGCTITINTNAKNGWYAWAKDSNSGLASTVASHTVASVTAGSQSDLNTTHGTEGYGLAITSISQGGACASTCGVTSAVSAYDSTASAGVNGLVGGIDGTLRNVASSTGVANAATLTVKERANINVTTQAATDYTDLVTIVGAG